MGQKKKQIGNIDFFKSHTKNVLVRCLVTESNGSHNNKLNSIVRSMGEKANYLIQNLNLMIPERQIPYISVQVQFTQQIQNWTRFVFCTATTPDTYLRSVQHAIDDSQAGVSHVIDVWDANGYRDIIDSNIDADAALAIEDIYIEGAMLDVLLDIAMFHSYSFFSDMSLPDQRAFSQMKYDFFKSQDLPCFYKINLENLHISYYSLAFSARTSKESIDLERYRDYWNTFVSSYFPDCQHIEPSVEQQLKSHNEYGQLPKDLSGRILEHGKGTWLVLRLYWPRSKKYEDSVKQLFGQKEKRSRICTEPVKTDNRQKAPYVGK